MECEDVMCVCPPSAEEIAYRQERKEAGHKQPGQGETIRKAVLSTHAYLLGLVIDSKATAKNRPGTGFTIDPVFAKRESRGYCTIHPQSGGEPIAYLCPAAHLNAWRFRCRTLWVVGMYQWEIGIIGYAYFL